MDKTKLVKGFIKDENVRNVVKDVSVVTIDLDATDLTFGDIIRNIHKCYPVTGRERNKIISGEKIVAALLKSKLLEPLRGVLMIFCADATQINAYSMTYAVLAISEPSFRDDTEILDTLDRISNYFIANYTDELPKFDKLYQKHIYDPDLDEIYSFS